MSKALKAIRGMNDILPQEAARWQQLESVCRRIAAQYGYQEIRLPVLEPTALFRRGVGDSTDIVEKEMYEFLDRNGDSVCLRPEGTAGCMRAGIEHGLFYHQTQKLHYLGPMFRHERPQKGRYRQFYQWGVEAVGYAGPAIDAELIVLTQRLWQALGVLNAVELQINSIGSSEDRAAYRAQLVAYFEEHHDQLDDDSKRRLSTNPLRILDSKNPALSEVIAAAPKLIDHLSEDSRQYFERLCQLLDQLGVRYAINPTLVRGLDYYSHTVFEWVTTELGAQGTVCAGGRYDQLVELLGGPTTPAIGFAMGMERVILLLNAQGELAASVPDIYAVLSGETAVGAGLVLAERIREALPSLQLELNLQGGSFKSQFKKADKSGAAYALVLGDDEVAAEQVVLKPLRGQAEPQVVAQSALIETIRSLWNE